MLAALHQPMQDKTPCNMWIFKIVLGPIHATPAFSAVTLKRQLTGHEPMQKQFLKRARRVSCLSDFRVRLEKHQFLGDMFKLRVVL